MSLSHAFYRSAPVVKPRKVIFYDVDGVLADPVRNTEGKYIQEADGFIDTKIINVEHFKKINAFAIENNVALHLLTGRDDNIPLNLTRNGDRNTVMLTGLIEQAGGFSESVGGFKRHCAIYYTGRMVENNKGKLVHTEMITKAEVVKSVHYYQYPHLAPNDILVIDDSLRYLTPIKAKGYQILYVTAEMLADHSHYALAEKFMSPALNINHTLPIVRL